MDSFYLLIIVKITEQLKLLGLGGTSFQCFFIGCDRQTERCWWFIKKFNMGVNLGIWPIGIAATVFDCTLNQLECVVSTSIFDFILMPQESYRCPVDKKISNRRSTPNKTFQLALVLQLSESQTKLTLQSRILRVDITTLPLLLAL